MSRAAIVEAQPDQSLCFEAREDFLANRPVEDTSGLFLRLEEIGKGEYRRRRRDVVQYGEVDPRHVELAVADLGRRMVLRIAIVVAQHRHAELAAAALSHQLVDLDDGLDRRIVQWIDVGGTEFPGIGPPGCTECEQQDHYMGCQYTGCHYAG